MRNRAACMVCALALLSPAIGGQSRQSEYRTALPGFSYEFPRDYFNHPEFQTEWWYYTGNLRTKDGHRFGFELTFFRQAVDRDAGKERPWDVRDLHLAHLALSDLDGSAFYHDERVNRAGPGIAGISEADRRIWNGNWSVEWQGDDQKLRATNGAFELEFSLHPKKRPVIHGENGVSQKAAGAGRASHYVSLTRLSTNGRIRLGGKNFDVAGLAWMDHEFFTHQLEADQVGWDWLSLQLEDKTELMLFRIRRKDGSVDPFSAGTFVDANGGQTHLRAGDFTLTPQGDVWKSPSTHASYPIRWKVSVPRLEIEVEAGTPLASQEITSGSKAGPNYWEGAIRISGRKGKGALSGAGYLEMTGYDRPFAIGK